MLVQERGSVFVLGQAIKQEHPDSDQELCRNDGIGRFRHSRSCQTIIQRVKRRKKQRGQVRFCDLEKLLIHSREGWRQLHRRRGVCTSRTDLIFSHDGILYQERTTWTRSVGTKSQSSRRTGPCSWTKDQGRLFAAFSGFLLLSVQRIFGSRC